MFSLTILVMTAAACHGAVHVVAPDGDDGGPGTEAQPWRTLQHSVDRLGPGDTLRIRTGTYRESVTLRRGGTKGKPIALESAPGARVVVSGADLLTGGWERTGESNEPIYRHPWPHRFPIAGPNDLTHPGDTEHEATGRAEQILHRGRLLRQVLRRDRLSHGTFFVDLDAGMLYVWLRDGGDPNRTEMEGSTRATWLAAEPGVSHVHLRGIRFRHAANHAQRGAFTLRVGNQSEASNETTGWVVEDCIFEQANASGASLTGEGHLFRRCVFQDNGQLGFGASFCHRTRLESCAILRNNTKGYSNGWEAGGLKVVLSRGFVFDRCRVSDNRGCGIWYDIGNEDSLVTRCVITDNDEAGIFYEISYGLRARDNLIVNNANLGESLGGAWGMGGITLSSSEDCVIENNTLVGNRDGIAFREQDRSTPRIDAPGKEVRVYNRNHLIRRNIIADSPAYGIAFWFDTTFFGPHPGGGDRDRPVSEDPKTLGIRFEANLLHTPPGRPAYLYGPLWRPKGRSFETTEEFRTVSGIADTSVSADPGFRDPLSGDFHTKPGSPARKIAAGARGGEMMRSGTGP